MLPPFSLVPHPILLGSTSPRRTEILHTLHIPHRIINPNVNEDLPKTAPQQYVLETARHKINAIRESSEIKEYPEYTLITADTVVTINGSDEILEKPKGKDDARRMIQKWSGNTVSVWSAICVCTHESDILEQVSKTAIEFSELTNEEIEAYLETDEPYDKAGGISIQGTRSCYIVLCIDLKSNITGCGAQFVQTLTGSPYNAVGLNPNCLSNLFYLFHRGTPKKPVD